jgi:hypothetical protein
MRPLYDDIIRRAGLPDWYDEGAVPRYGRFDPRQVSNVYAREAALVLIRCRACGGNFKVAVSRPNASPVPNIPISELIATRQLLYGDPPNAKCCARSQFSRSVTEKVLEYWHKVGARYGWARDPTFEVSFASPLEETKTYHSSK